MVIVVLGGAVSDAMSSTLLAGALAGWSAGRFTVRVRQLHGGKDRLQDVLWTYYLGFSVYWAAGLLIGFFSGHLSLEGAVLIVPAFMLAALAATILGVLLIPLCYATRLLVWTFHVHTQPSTQSLRRHTPPK
jgi:uncharacterized membrane protein YfcA